ncbi:hypothetical protein VM1G_06496 [Cytospora mali]|uniref:MARVEL domain-containing protein n=1 Tax=Cytospora mali TaxID=578113 RepID=A0A194W415_CYTMA|nr:hypothetical protein VM1G_06496 [Valsa mali]
MMRTGFRNHGYYGHTFVGSRLLSGIALLAILGLIATFISEINHAKLIAPEQLIAALIISCCALLWVLLSFTAYDDTHIPYLATAIVDAVFLIPFIAAVVVLGGPLNQTDCSTLPSQSGNGNTTTLDLSSADTSGNGTISYDTLVGSNQTTCYKLQATWGLIIALAILFVFSGIAAAFMFLGKRRNGYSGNVFGKNTARYGDRYGAPQ